MAKILFAGNPSGETKESIRQFVRRGHTVTVLDDPQAAHPPKEAYDLLLAEDDFAQCASVKAAQQPGGCPVLRITEKNVPVFLGGTAADDYIVCPFPAAELCARAERLLRHGSIRAFDLGGCHVEFAAHRAFSKGREVSLTPQEFRLLYVLVCGRDQVMTREQLLRAAWGFTVQGDTRTVDVHIQKLRKKLEIETQLRTVHKVGYCLDTQ